MNKIEELQLNDNIKSKLADGNQAKTLLNLPNDTVAALNNKQDAEAGKGLSEENYTTTEKNKLAGIEAGAEVNTVNSVNSQTGNVVINVDDLMLLLEQNPLTFYHNTDENLGSIEFLGTDGADGFAFNFNALGGETFVLPAVTGVAATTDDLKKATFTVELIDENEVDFYAPDDLKINSTEVITGSGTVTIEVNDAAYTFGNVIDKGDKITVEVDDPSVVNLFAVYE